DHPRALAHRGGDADDARVKRRHVAEPLPEDLRIARAGGLFLEDGATDRIERTWAMPLDRVLFRGVVTLALRGDHVQQLWALEIAHVAQRRHQLLDVVAIHRADVVEAQLLED